MSPGRGGISPGRRQSTGTFRALIRRAPSIHVYSFSAGRRGVLAYQKATFGAFLRDDRDLIVVIDVEMWRSAHRAAAALGPQTLRVPTPYCHDASRGLGQAMVMP